MVPMETNRFKALTVSYDLIGRCRTSTYRKLWSELMKLGGERQSRSTWIMVTDLSAGEVSALLSSLLQRGDKLSVAEISGPVWATVL